MLSVSSLHGCVGDSSSREASTEPSPSTSIATSETEPAQPSLPVGPEYLEVEELYVLSSMQARSIAVDDDWIYFMGWYDAHYAAFRLPKRADPNAEPEELGPYVGENGGLLIDVDDRSVAWATFSPADPPARLYVRDLESDETTGVDLEMASRVAAVRVADDYFAVVGTNCIYTQVVDRASLEMRLVVREDATYLGGTTGVLVDGNQLYCAADKLWRMDLTDGEWVELMTVTFNSGIRGMFFMGEQLAYMGGAGDAGLLDPFAPDAGVTPIPKLQVRESYPMYSPRHDAIYWATRRLNDEAGANLLIVYDANTWQRVQLPMPRGQTPANGIAQDADYLYWGDAYGTTGRITRTKKLTYGEILDKYFGIDWDGGVVGTHFGGSGASP